MDRILLAHGGGGSLTNDLIKDVIVPALGSDQRDLADASPVPGRDDILFTTDSFVVKPLFFPGGDIGSLAIHGTVNDLAVSGARPLAVSISLVIEEGFEIATLKKILESAGKAAKKSGVSIVTGDTKVVAKGEADGMFITTSGVGERLTKVLPSQVVEGDVVIINGSIGDHGVAVMSAREGIEFETTIESDSQPVWPFVEAMINGNIEVHTMRDPTRGGVAASCNEIADPSDVSIVLDENALPVKEAVTAACGMLGLDSLTVANEGKVLFFVPQSQAEKALGLLKGGSVIGAVVSRRDKGVYLKTQYGGERIVEMPYGEQLPRIC